MPATLKTKILGIDFENPFLLSSAPPTACKFAPRASTKPCN